MKKNNHHRVDIISTNLVYLSKKKWVDANLLLPWNEKLDALHNFFSPYLWPFLVTSSGLLPQKFCPKTCYNMIFMSDEVLFSLGEQSLKLVEKKNHIHEYK